MSTDEEYLDNLLKTMSTDDTEENNDNKIMSLMNETDPMENRTAPMRKEVFSDIRPEDEIPPADKKDDEKKPVVDESWKAELDEMLAKADKAQEGLESVPEEPVEKKKEKKKRHFLFGKKVKDKDSREQDSAQTEPAEMADNDQEGQENGEPFEEPDWADEIPEKNEKKKKGFLGNLLETLFREEPDIDIEEETEEKPEKEKKEKKKKEKKGKSKEKNKATEAEGGEESEGKGTEDKKAEKKREKQQKKEEKKRKKEQEPKQPRVLNRKSLLTLVAFDATLISAVLLLGIFLPDYIDRREARNAFYDGDYVTVYQNLHGKGLGESDTVLYNRAAVVEKLQRKLNSYQINERTGNRAQALDALLSGAAVYDDIMAAGNAYGAENELAILYQQIIDTLQSQFQVDEAVAREVNSYESDDDYSEAVYSLINNGKLPESETEETEETGNATEQLPDLLKEEEDLMENVDSSF